MEDVSLSIFDFSDRPVTPEMLHPLERAEMGRLGLDGPRALEWMRGRSAVRQTLRRFKGSSATSAALLTRTGGAPRLIEGPDCRVSLSHEETYVGVALSSSSDRSVGVDLCLRREQDRLRPILKRIGAAWEGHEPAAVWAALEAVLKLRGWPVTRLLELGEIRLWDCPGAIPSFPRGEFTNIPGRFAPPLQRQIRVQGLGDPARVRVLCFPRFFLAGCGEAP